jgi:hypothetical protein
MNNNLPIAYMYFHARLLDACNGFNNKEMRYRNAWTIVSKSRLPRAIFHLMMREMEKYGLIKRINRYSFQIKRVKEIKKEIKRINQEQIDWGVYVMRDNNLLLKGGQNE